MVDEYATMPTAQSPNERSLVTQVIEFTGVSDLVAVLALRQSNWRVEHAAELLFSDRRDSIDRDAQKYEAAAKNNAAAPKEVRVSLPSQVVLTRLRVLW